MGLPTSFNTEQEKVGMTDREKRAIMKTVEAWKPRKQRQDGERGNMHLGSSESQLQRAAVSISSHLYIQGNHGGNLKSATACYQQQLQIDRLFPAPLHHHQESSLLNIDQHTTRLLWSDSKTSNFLFSRDDKG